MKTIKTTITVQVGGQIEIPPQPELEPGEHQAMLVVERPESATGEDDRSRVAVALRAAGILATLTREEQEQAARSTLMLAELGRFWIGPVGNHSVRSFLRCAGPRHEPLFLRFQCPS